MDKPVVVDNKPGGDASIGAGLFASVRDDHTLLYGTSSIITVNPLVQGALPYDSAKDFVPISSGASAILVVAVKCGAARSIAGRAGSARQGKAWHPELGVIRAPACRTMRFPFFS